MQQLRSLEPDSVVIEFHTKRKFGAVNLYSSLGMITLCVVISAQIGALSLMCTPDVDPRVSVVYPNKTLQVPIRAVVGR